MKKITLILAVFILMVSCNRQKGFDQQEAGNNCKANVIDKEQLVDLLYSDGIDNVQYIDIRTPHDYAMGHLPGAINIPMKNFFNKKYFSKIDDDAVLIIYGYDASSPLLLTLISSHFNKGFFNVALGGYDYLQSKIIDNFAIYSGTYDDEEPLVDFQQAVNEIRNRSGAGNKNIKPIEKKAILKQPVKRKKKEISGGCG